MTGASVGLPFLALAADPNFGYLDSVIRAGSDLLNNLVIFLFALAVVWFIWNVVRYAMSEDEEGKSKAKSQMIWGIVAIAVTVSVWGLVAILRTAFGVDTNNQIPTNINYMIPGGDTTLAPIQYAPGATRPYQTQPGGGPNNPM